MKHFPEWRMMTWTQGLKKAKAWLVVARGGKESDVGRPFRDFVHSKAKVTILLSMSEMILPKKSSSPYLFSGTSNEVYTSLPSLSPVKLGHKGLEFATTFSPGCSQPIGHNPRCTAPLSSCCAIVLAVSVGAIRCMACNCFEIAQGCLSSVKSNESCGNTAF